MYMNLLAHWLDSVSPKRPLVQCTLTPTEPILKPSMCLSLSNMPGMNVCSCMPATGGVFVLVIRLMTSFPRMPD